MDLVANTATSVSICSTKSPINNLVTQNRGTEPDCSVQSQMHFWFLLNKLNLEGYACGMSRHEYQPSLLAAMNKTKETDCSSRGLFVWY
jgi:hypothetical protein